MNNSQILVVDDDPDQIDLLTMLFQSKGHKVLAADDFETAKKLLAENRIDIMVTDYCMPDGTGNLLLKEKRRAPINVLVSGHFFEKVEWHKKFGFDAYFLKPCDPRSLLAAIVECVKRRSLFRKSA